MDLITAGTALASFVAGKGAKAQLQTIDDLWYLVFNPISQMADKKRIENELNINHYRNTLGKMLLDIPEENLQDPPLSIVGPALEASKYYIEEEELRKMFAKVIASSMDNRIADSVHHSFVEIIKQLSPRDAKNILEFKGKDNSPIVNYAARKITGESYEMIRPLVFSPLGSYIIEERDFSSVSNLIRLGLLNFTFERYLYNCDFYYKFYRDNPLFHEINDSINKEDSNLEVNNGALSITTLGKEFIKVCL